MKRVIADRLEKSGHFRLVNSADFSELAAIDAPVYQGDPRYAAWRNLGVDYLVSVRGFFYSGLSNDDKNRAKNEIQFQLLDLVNGRQLVGYDLFSSNKHYPSVGEFLASEVYRELTGSQADFQSRSAFLRLHGDSQDAGDLMVLSASGGASSLVSSPRRLGPMSFSTDGAWLAYQSFESGRGELFLQELSTGRRESLAVPTTPIESIAWSPDSSLLALSLAQESQSTIHLLDLNTRQQQKVRAIPAGHSPVWSADGLSLLYLVDGDNEGSLRRYHISRGTVEILLTGLPSGLHLFSAPGHDRLYALNKHAVLVLRHRGGKLRAEHLFNAEGIIGVPAVSPHGHMMMYAAAKEGRQVITTRVLDTGASWDIGSEAYRLAAPVWAMRDSVTIDLVNENRRVPPSIDRRVIDRLKRIAHRANNGDTASAMLMAKLYSNNRPQASDPPDDPEVAFYFTARAADSGDTFAAKALAERYYQGDGVARDVEQAVVYFRRHAQGAYSFNSYEDLARALIELGEPTHLEEATQWMNKEMQARSIPRSASIVDAQSQFFYLYEGGRQAEERAAQQRKREQELAALTAMTNREPLRYNDLIIGLSSPSDVISHFRDGIYDHHLKGKFSRLSVQNIEQSSFRPRQDVEIVCLNYRPLYSTRNVTDCYFFENDAFVGFHFDRSQLNCPSICQWGEVELQNLDKKFQIGATFAATQKETNGNTLRRKWQRGDMKLNTLRWGQFAAQQHKNVGGIKRYDRTNYGLQATLCLFPERLEPLLQSLEADRGNYTCD